MERIEQTLRAAWGRVATRYPGYALVLPGDPGFICQAQECKAHCCHAFSVSLGEAEVHRMAAASGFPWSRFLESEGGEALALPLVKPYLLAREDGHCALLQGDMSCGQYGGRPDACRLYPHQVLLVGSDGESASSTPEAVGAALVALFEGRESDTVPLLLRHGECPGFTGAPMTVGTWSAQVAEVAQMQDSLQ